MRQFNSFLCQQANSANRPTDTAITVFSVRGASARLGARHAIERVNSEVLNDHDDNVCVIYTDTGSSSIFNE